MNQDVFSVFDSAAKRFLEPFFAENSEVAVRMFRSVVSKPGHQFNRFPADYTLFRLGAFDAVTGALEPLATPENLGVALFFVEAPADA